MKIISTRKLRRRWTNMVRRLVFGSYSQYGEDLIIDAIVGKEKLFYVDIGANHPINLSNTYRFYRRGGTGINIEPDPTVFPLLASCRTKDINLQIGVSTLERVLPFYRMSANTLSTFNKADADSHDDYQINEVIQVPVRPLAAILSDHIPSGGIDFMSIDAEGYEMEIIESNNWERFRPLVLMLEINRNEQKLVDFMERLDYALVVNNETNGIFLDCRARRSSASTKALT
ncbi:MAG: FkbM family methyltransferase [Verrucomicrobiota bacterium]